MPDDFEKVPLFLDDLRRAEPIVWRPGKPRMDELMGAEVSGGGSDSGFIYGFRPEPDRFFKLGRAGDLERRLKKHKQNYGQSKLEGMSGTCRASSDW